MTETDVTKITEKEIRAALKAAYHIGFSDAAHYMIIRNFDDNPTQSGYYHAPELCNLEARMEACAQADDREGIHGKAVVNSDSDSH